MKNHQNQLQRYFFGKIHLRSNPPLLPQNSQWYCEYEKMVKCEVPYMLLSLILSSLIFQKDFQNL